MFNCKLKKSLALTISAAMLLSSCDGGGNVAYNHVSNIPKSTWKMVG